MNYYSVSFGEFGSGKSSFIKAFLKYGKKDDTNCISGSDWQGVTKQINQYDIQRNNVSSDKFYFIDTPGLNEVSLDKQNIEIMRDESSGNSDDVSKIRYILFIMKVTDYRLTDSITKMIEELINVFPSPNFWELIIVIRTHTIVDDRIDAVKVNFLDSIVQDKTINEILKEKGINKPYHIKEFYVNTVVKKTTNTNMNKEINEIQDAITHTDTLYGEVKYSATREKKVGHTTIIYKIMSFRDFQSNEWHDVEKIIETKGSKSLIKKPVGSPYSKRCKKGKFQKFQDYIQVYDEKGNYDGEEKYGIPYKLMV